jgi:cytochrome bd-type quinol oxidase subunit 1
MVKKYLNVFSILQNIRAILKFSMFIVPGKLTSNVQPIILKINNSIYLSVYLIAICWTSAAFSVSWFFYTVCRTPWTGDHTVARPLSAHRTPQTQNKRTQTSMPPVGFEHTIQMFKRAKTVHASDRAATVIGSTCLGFIYFWILETVVKIKPGWYPF